MPLFPSNKSNYTIFIVTFLLVAASVGHSVYLYNCESTTINDSEIYSTYAFDNLGKRIK